MTTAATSTSGSLWQDIRDDAQRAIAADPVFGKSLADTVLIHGDFAAALADLIGRRLGGSAAEQARFNTFSLDAFRGAPDLIGTAACDLQAIALRDPAIAELLPPLLHYKGYVALQAWRVSHWHWHRGHIDAALLFQNEASNALQVSIHPAASIGSGVYLDHATGIVIGANAVIGDAVTILQNVSIGRHSELPACSPRIGRGVYIGGGATILGDISIGDFAKIGAGTVVTSDIPAGCTAVGNPARLTNCPEPASAA
ncbi:serine acetyltransferase [Bradyrhizobium sacchari]|uniref:Serine acetyltransferase n=1 Tax=Bradyrhizobium sacchari TaxID=1399419 RepID=A0A560JH07_9BRAD|nr:serine acetyltransferase [Bradyrhizobium sacchari]OPY95145.1 serine acetyltransferase [Bradyrhizobium sacchari]TWB49698.1 serine O-acetyltransferase [Bradyrhizobium sacchari]TWB68644.1 serine O-acetyltransferase [Bradyrhizobium sacchari]